MGNSPSHDAPSDDPPTNVPPNVELDESPSADASATREPDFPAADPDPDAYVWNRYGLIEVSTGRLCDVPTPKTKDEAAGFRAQVARLLDSKNGDLVRRSLIRAIHSSLDDSKPPATLNVGPTTPTTPSSVAGRIQENEFATVKKKPALPTVPRFTPVDLWCTETCHQKIEDIIKQIKKLTGKCLDHIDFTTMKLVFHPLLQKDRTANRFEAYWCVLKLHKHHHDFDLGEKFRSSYVCSG